MTVRVIASGDHHWCEASRWDECVRVHDFMVDLVARERPDAFLSGGDIFDRRSTPKEREHVARWLTRMAEHCPVVCAKGNHDESLSLLGELRSKHPIIIEQRAGVHRVGALRVAAMAWPSKSTLAAMLPGSLEEQDLAARDALRSVLRGLGQQLASGVGPTILLGHFMINGAVLSAGNPMIGAELNVGLEDLGLVGADVTIAAHIHRRQTWSHNGRPILYTGSPFRTAFGEVEEKSVALVSINDGEVDVQHVPTPCARMLLVSVTWESGALRWTGVHQGPDLPGSLDGAEVRLRYTVEGDRRDEARAAARGLEERWLAAGAALVKVEEEVVATQRARAPEIAAAVSIEDKLRALWARQGVEGERVERLLGRVKEVAA